MNNSRRSFIKKAALASVAPIILPSHLVAGETKPSGRINVGFIGLGKMGTGLLKNLIHYEIQVVAVCDVDKNRRENAQAIANEYYKRFPGKGTADCKTYNDLRELIARDDIHAVVIATPDHWHAYPTVAALKAGKDVYCEKPLTHNIHEAITVMETVKKTGRVLQTGSMQRSMTEFRVVCEMVRNGVVGKISHVDCSFGGPGRPCDLPEEAMEPGLDWNMWIGPAKMRPYNSVLSPRGVYKHFPKWRRYKEFGGGAVCDWGAKGHDTGAKLIYANGIEVNHTSGNGILFHGDKGQVKVNRGRFELTLEGKIVAQYDRNDRSTSLHRELVLAEGKYLKNAKIKVYNSKNHLQDFLDCVESRKKPITNEIVGARSAICCHLMNQAYYNHAKIKWDPKKLDFTKGTGKPEWLTRNYRLHWSV